MKASILLSPFRYGSLKAVNTQVSSELYIVPLYKGGIDKKSHKETISALKAPNS